MVKIPEQLKNMIIDWCKQDNIDCKEIPQKEDSVMIWNLGIGKPEMSVYIQHKLHDRIYFQHRIAFTDEQQKMINETWQKSKKNSMILNLQRNSVTFDVFQTFLGGTGKITGILEYLIDSNPSFEKHDFIKKLLRIQQIQTITFNILNTSLGTEMNILKQQQNAKDSKNPLTG